TEPSLSPRQSSRRQVSGVFSTRVWLLALLFVFSHASSAIAKGRRPKAHRKPAHVTLGLAGLVRGGPWLEPTFADSTDGDRLEGDDPAVRYIAAQALGPYNGAVVVVDSASGRVLSILNQKLALKGGFQPCSTFKVPVALAALCEKVIEPDSASGPNRKE